MGRTKNMRLWENRCDNDRHGYRQHNHCIPTRMQVLFVDPLLSIYADWNCLMADGWKCQYMTFGCLWCLYNRYRCASQKRTNCALYLLTCSYEVVRILCEGPFCERHNINATCHFLAAFDLTQQCGWLLTKLVPKFITFLTFTSSWYAKIHHDHIFMPTNGLSFPLQKVSQDQVTISNPHLPRQVQQRGVFTSPRGKRNNLMHLL